MAPFITTRPLPRLTPVHLTGEWFCDYFVCKECGERVERGIINVSSHSLTCSWDLNNDKPLSPVEQVYQFNHLLKTTGCGYKLNRPEVGQPELNNMMINKEKVAKMAHEVNRAYCLAMGDASQPAWEDAPQWQKDSAINGVQFHLENPNATPENSHESWMKQKEEEGWKYGPVKDPEKKEHPCFLPYGELPVEQRAKDYLFRAVIHTMFSLIELFPTKNMTFGQATHAAKAGFKVARAGWNGKGMYAVIMPGYPEGIEANEATQKAHNIPAGTRLVYRPYWQLYTAQRDVAMWAPSGSDSLAEDWMIVTGEDSQQSGRPLQAPAAHSLPSCLKELKFGRKAEEQKFLDEVIQLHEQKFNDVNFD